MNNPQCPEKNSSQKQSYIELIAQNIDARNEFGRKKSPKITVISNYSKNIYKLLKMSENVRA